MQHEFAVSGRWSGDFSEEKMRLWAAELRGRLRAPKVSLGLVFMTPNYFEAAPQILEVLRLHGQIPLLIGCSSSTLIVGSEELEEQAGIVVSLLSLPGGGIAPGSIHPGNRRAVRHRRPMARSHRSQQ
jgi:small ligand-binding sensory domain FIST